MGWLVWLELLVQNPKSPFSSNVHAITHGECETLILAPIVSLGLVGGSLDRMAKC